MDELRRDVNQAFNKGQAELGDLGGVRERILKGALGARSTRTDYRLHFAAGIAAILIAALVIATFIYVRAGSQPTPGQPQSGQLNVPDSTPVILYHDPENFYQVDGVTWDGRTSGRVGQGDYHYVGGTSNPAGTLYSTSTAIRDRSGKAVLSLKGFTGAWADDERHYCEMVPAGGLDVSTPAVLMLVSLGARPSTIARIGTFPAAGDNRPPPSVAACSVENDRAVVFQPETTLIGAAMGSLTVRVWVVQLSTGRTIWTNSVIGAGSPAGVSIVATHDGQFVAESILAFQATATIYGPDGLAVTQIMSSVDAFSWDGSLVVTSPSSGTPVSLNRWRGGAVVWSGPVGSYFRVARAEPGGSRVAIGLVELSPADEVMVLGRTLYIISADGQLNWRKTVYLV